MTSSSYPFRFLCTALTFLHLLTSFPAGLLALTPNPQAPPQSTVKPNRTQPSSATSTTPNFLRFSNKPTDQEIYRAKVLREPFLPFGQSDETQNTAFAETLQQFARRTNLEDASNLTDFLERYPNSVWRISILGNLGDFYYHTGYFSKALTAWEEAWQLCKQAETRNAKNPSNPSLLVQQQKRLADWIVGELAEMNSRVGRFERLGPLLKEVENRELIGPGAERISRAKNGLWCMQNRPTRTFVCGTAALRQCAQRAGLPFETQEKIMAEECSLHGFYLKELYDIAQKNGLNYQIVKREPGAPIPNSLLPLVIHWKVKHYGALLAQEDGKFLMSDPIFDVVDQWMSTQAIDEESTGYCLVPAVKGELPSGWRSVSEEEISDIWGKGKDTSPDDNNTKDDDDQTGKDPCGGMAVYSIHTLLASLHLEDIPVGYQPPVGQGIFFKIMYNQREVQNPANFTFSHFGPKWSFNWTAYVVDDPLVPQATLKVTRNGGADVYPYDAVQGKHLPEIKNCSTLTKISEVPLRYERQLVDGTVEVFERSDGTTGPGRRVFLTQIIDPQGNSVQIYYDDMNRITSIEDAIGQISTFKYGEADPYRISAIVDPFGRYARFQYNADGLLETITDVIGITSQFQYGPGDFVNALITPYGRTEFTTGQQGANRWIETLDPYGDRERVEYRSFKVEEDNPTFAAAIGSGTGWQYNPYINERNTFVWDKKAMKLGGAEDYTKARIIHWLNLNGHHNLISGIKESTKEPLEERVGYRYPNQDAYNGTNPDMIGKPDLIERTLDDGTVQRLRYGYNDFGNVTNSIDERSRNFSYVYSTNQIDLLEMRQTKGAANELLWHGTYNNQHQLLTSIGGDGQTNTYTYNARGQISTYTNPRNEVTTYDYDADGYLTSISQQGIVMSEMTYDAYGRVHTLTDSEGYTLTMEYDDLDRLTRLTYPNGDTQEWVYDKLDAVRHKDRLGKITHFHFNSLRQLVALQDALGRTMNFEWCKCGKLQGFTDPQGKITKWKYDVQGRLIEKTYPDNTTVSYGYYTNVSWLHTRTDAMNQKTHYTYYPDNRLASISYSDTVHLTPSVTYNYSLTYPRLTSMTDGTGNTTYSYNPITPVALGAGQLATINGPLNADLITYTYDELGRVNERRINNVLTAFTYDDLERLATVTNPLGTFTNTYWNDTARLQQMDYPNGQRMVLDYYDNNGDQRLQQIHNLTTNNVTLSQFDYEYATDGTISRWIQQLGNSPATTIDLHYDKLNQLLAATYRQNGQVTQTFGYQYDKAGNRLTEQVNETVQQAVFNNLNQLRSRQTGGAVLFKGNLNENGEVTVNNQPALVTGGTNFAQTATLGEGTNVISIVATDDNNNVTTNLYQVAVNSSEQERFEYDFNGNMISRSTEASATYYDWDGANRLIQITQRNATSTNVSEFTYDGLSRRTRIVERENGVVTRDNRFVWEGSSLVEERNSTGFLTNKRYYSQGVQVSGQNYYYSRDHLGSIRELTDASRTIRARYDYDPYGRKTKLEGDLDADFSYTGHYYHSPSGLVLALYRAYDSDLGRWLSQDPISFSAGDINLYRYCFNDCMNWVDPNGLLVGEGPVLGALGGAGLAGLSTAAYEGTQYALSAGKDPIDYGNIGRNAAAGAVAGAAFGTVVTADAVGGALVFGAALGGLEKLTGINPFGSDKNSGGSGRGSSGGGGQNQSRRHPRNPTPKSPDTDGDGQTDDTDNDDDGDGTLDPWDPAPTDPCTK